MREKGLIVEPWIYNEFIHCGVDYSDIKEAQDYDNQHEEVQGL